MKRSLSLLFAVLSFGLQAQIINIPQDYPTIQEGIDNAITGDTVLVAPGIYYENLTIDTKSIILASHFLLTQDTSYISQTIIDGDSIGTCLTITGVNDTNTISMISGFTIRNGAWFGGYGGGINCQISIPILDHLIVENNSAYHGGGIYINGGYYHYGPIIQNSIIRNNKVYYAEGEPGKGAGIYCSSGSYYASPVIRNVLIECNQANLPIDVPGYGSVPGAGLGGGICGQAYLCNVTIRNNQATKGGGIYGSCIFDSIELCNIYRNAACEGNDIYGGGQVFLDTFSVKQPKNFHAAGGSFTFDIQHGLMEQVSADMYISPNGSYANSGLSKDEPLPNIHCALSKLIVDNQNPVTLHLLSGTYKTSETHEFFPVILPYNTNVSGQSSNQVFLDAEQQAGVFLLQDCGSICLSDITITGGYGSYWDGSEWGLHGGGIHCDSANVKMNEVIVEANRGKGGGIQCNNSVIDIKHSHFRNNEASGWSTGGGIYSKSSYVNLINSYFNNNKAASGSGLYVNEGTILLQNIGLFRNVSGPGGCIHISEGNAKLINVSIADNDISWQNGNPGIVCWKANLQITNTILYNNGSSQITCEEDFYQVGSTISAQYSDLKNGEMGIILTGIDSLYWGPGNINVNPMFSDTLNNDFSLSSGSPCIDAGTPDTSGLNLPDYDLAGNPRIWNKRIDMGAYEWNNIGVFDHVSKTKDRFFNVYPNPASNQINIEYELQQYSNVQVALYDNYGRQVILLNDSYQQKGPHNLNLNVEKVSPGLYFLHMLCNEGSFSRKLIIQ